MYETALIQTAGLSWACQSSVYTVSKDVLAYQIVYAQLLVTVKVRAYAAATIARETSVKEAFIVDFEGAVRTGAQAEGSVPLQTGLYAFRKRPYLSNTQLGAYITQKKEERATFRGIRNQ